MKGETEMGKRFRAAREYGGFRGRVDYADAVRLSPSTQQRIESEDRQLEPGEALYIEKITGVPAWFLEDGWEGWRAIARREASVDQELEEASAAELEGRDAARPPGSADTAADA